MVRKILAGLVLAVLWCSGALGATGVFSSHRSIVDFDGTPDYSTARFLSMWVEIVGDTQAAQADVNLTGSITFSGGSYSFWDGKNGMRTISGTPHTFGLASNMSVGDYLDYLPMTASGDNVVFCLGADGGLNGVNVSWNFPDNTSYNGQGIVPHYRTTQEQLESYVPYVEYVRNGSQVTGLRWRIVDPDNTSEAVTLDFASSFIASVQNAAGNTLYSGQWAYIEAGDIVSGEVTFDSPINEADISRIRVAFNRWNEDSENSYQWYFCKPSEPKTWLFESHTFDAALVNGKSDYSNAKFNELYFDIRADEGIIAEADHFMANASVMIPDGGYTLGDNYTAGDDNAYGKAIETIPVGTDKTFKLRMSRGIAPSDSLLEYQPVYDDGTYLEFRRDAETSFPGKVLTWTIPEYPSLSGSAAFSSFKSTAQQLAEGVPYIELVSADGKLTAVNFRMVTSSDTSRALTLPYRTNFRFYFNRITPDVTGDDYPSSWMYNTSSGTWTLDNPQPLSNMHNITVRYRSWEDPDNPDKYLQYQWKFFPASPAAPDPAPSALTITTTSLPAATTGTAYSATLAANTSGVTWSVLSGTLPAGLTLNSSSGAITGTPTIAGTSTFTVRAVSGTQSAEKQLSITVNPINPTPVTALTITTTSLPAATPGTPYSTTLTANSSGVIWSLVSGILPAGLTLSSSGTISGTPTTAGSSSFTVRAVSGSQSAEKSLSITVNPPKGSVGSSGGGCESFAGLSGLLILAVLFRKLHHSA